MAPMRGSGTMTLGGTNEDSRGVEAEGMPKVPKVELAIYLV